DGAGKCRVHAVKPAACKTYPATFVDDGEVVRVSIAIECACALASAAREGGEPLVPGGARTRGDLPARLRVRVLPERIAITANAAATRAEIAAWPRAPFEAGDDPAASLWSLAAAIEAGGLGASATIARPAMGDVRPWLLALARRATIAAESAGEWRSARDRT